jgi:hypothetical protein
MTYSSHDDRLRHLIAREINPHVASWKLAFFIANGIVTSREVRGELKRIAEAHAAAEHCGDRNCEHCWTASVTAAAPSAPADRAAVLRAETAEDLRSDLYDDLDSFQRQTGISGLQHAQIRDHLATYLVEGLLRRAANEAQVVADDPCPGFPDRCPNPVLVNPDPPAHFGGVRCGCGKHQPAGEAQQPETQAAADCPYGEGPGDGSGCIKPAGHDGDHVVTPGVAVVPCSRAVLHQPHIPHSWWPQPGMAYVHCPGHSVDTAVVSQPDVARQADTAGEQQ